MPEFDYIVVGAGSAGGVLAARLSEDADLRVLLIEAGGRTDHWSIRMPAALASNFEGGPWNWCYHSVPQRHLAGRRIFQPRGKGLGGSSAINGMAYIRGHALDYQRWAEEGAVGWSYAEVLPYFRRSECHSRGEDPWRGGSGPMATVCYGMDDPLSRAFVEAGAVAGFPVTHDVNGYQQEGFGPFDRNIDRGERASTAHAFINPARSRPNLRIRTDTVVRKVLLEGRRARGVVCSSDGGAETLHAEREVILAAGAFHSPQLLMLSGVGPADHVRDHGIAVAHDLPGVGANLQDHLEVHLQWRADRRHARNRYAEPLAGLVVGARWFLTRRGVCASTQVEVGAFTRTSPQAAHPDIQYHFFPFLFDGWRPSRRESGFCVCVGTLRERSRGTLRLACADPTAPPLTVRLLGCAPMVFFTDPGAIRQIFTGNSKQFRAGKASAVFKMFFGPNSLLLLDGYRHRRERRLLMPPFHGVRMRLYGEMMCEIADRSIDAWPVERSFPVYARLQDITLEVMLRVVFGVADETRLLRLGKAVVESLDLWDVGSPLRPIKALWRFRRVRREIDELLLDEVRRRRAEEAEGRTDIMSMLVTAHDDDGSAMSDEEVRDEMFTMLVAGHETTATLLARVIHRLLENPDVLEAARAEVASVVGSGPRPPAPAAEQIARLGYLDAVIKETARLHPVVPIVVRQLETDHAVGSVALPAGCIAAPCIYLVHRRPDLWPEPSSFDPRRFMGRRTDPYTFFPFGGGARHCLGAAFATYEAKIVLSRVLSRVNLQADPNYAVRVVRRGLALGPSAGLPVIRKAA